MGRHGRSHKFLDHWHRRELPLPDGDVLSWTLMDDPARPPHAECFRLTSSDGSSRLLHSIEAARLLVEHGHPEAEHVRLERHVGQPFTH